jgi:hypothetical protein
MDDAWDRTGVLFMQGIFTLAGRSEGLKDGGNHALAQGTIQVRGIDKAKVVGGYGKREAGFSMFKSLALFAGKGKETGDLSEGGNPMGDLPMPIIPHLFGRVRKIGLSELGGATPTGVF